MGFSSTIRLAIESNELCNPFCWPIHDFIPGTLELNKFPTRNIANSIIRKAVQSHPGT